MFLKLTEVDMVPPSLAGVKTIIDLEAIGNSDAVATILHKALQESTRSHNIGTKE